MREGGTPSGCSTTSTPCQRRATADARGDRPFDDYAKGTIVGTPEMIRERLQPVIDAGIDYFIVTIPREA
jgi:alkanesulfonate monooxygenase SsuD/methylene tetrahydromethanopterin reductase-like flavin-dependent oxidoreductase (luciferase family)